MPNANVPNAPPPGNATRSVTKYLPIGVGEGAAPVAAAARRTTSPSRRTTSSWLERSASTVTSVVSTSSVRSAIHPVGEPATYGIETRLKRASLETLDPHDERLAVVPRRQRHRRDRAAATGSRRDGHPPLERREQRLAATEGGPVARITSRRRGRLADRRGDAGRLRGGLE